MSVPAGGKVPLMTQRGPREKSHPVRLYLDRVASIDVADYPDYDLTVGLEQSAFI